MMDFINGKHNAFQTTACFRGVIRSYVSNRLEAVVCIVDTWIVTLTFTCLLAILYVYHMCLCYRSVPKSRNLSYTLILNFVCELKPLPVLVRS